LHDGRQLLLEGHQRVRGVGEHDEQQDGVGVGRAASEIACSSSIRSPLAVRSGRHAVVA
jgi:hypothetical protein